jgi:cephalosporin-C deacetylase
MPLIDLPLDQLRTFRGLNPRPDDFDAYWDSALAEVSALDPQVHLEPHDCGADFAECFHLTFTGVRGARIYAKYLRPKAAPKPHPAVLIFHGYAMNSGDWVDKLGYVARGYSVAALDCRGQGGLSEDVGGVKGTTLHGHFIRGLDGPPEDMLFRHLFCDTAQLAQIVMAMPEVDAARVGAMGGSQGGGLTLACAALEPRVKLAAPDVPFLCDYRRVWEMDLARGAYEELRDYFRKFDPRHAKEDAIFTQLGYIDVQHLAPRIRGEVSMAVGLMDEICPPSTQFAAYNRMTCKKSLSIYPDYAHESLPGRSDEVFRFMGRL